MSNSNTPTVPKKLLNPFILVTSLFALWGFANDITNPMVSAFKKILELNKNTVMTRLFRARNQLKEILEDKSEYKGIKNG